MDHDLRVGQRDALALRAAGEQERAHARCHADADGGNVALDILHGVIDRHAGGHAAAGRVDIKLDILIGVLRLKIEELGDDEARGGVVDLLAEENDAVVEQAGENVIGPLAAAGLLDNIRD